MYKSWMWKQRSFREQFQGDDSGGSVGGSAGAAQQEDVDQDQGDAQQPDGETPSGEQQDASAGDGQGDADEGVIVTIGDEVPPSDEDEQFRAAPDWVKNLRKSDREKAKRIRELEQQVAATQQAAQPQAIEVGPEPKLEDFDYDGAAYRDALLAWNGRKTQAEEQAKKAREEQEAAATAWNQKLTAYKTAGAALKVDDFDGAEHVVQSTLSQLQQNMIVHAVDKPELVVYALGSNPAKAKELAAIKDPVKFAVALGKLETQLKVTPRKQPPAPEKQVRTTTGGAVAVDNTLERLRAEADRTGDRSHVSAYLRNRSKAAA
jgi:hypothetical protein